MTDSRQLLVSAILAFDLLIKDCIARESKGEELHEVAIKVLKFLESLLSQDAEAKKPEAIFDHIRQQYMLNVSEIGARIKIIFATMPTDDQDVLDMLELQAERLKWLGKESADSEDNKNIRTLQ